MASKHVVTLSSIVEFFENDTKAIKKGENALESNHVKKMQFDADFMIIRGEVHASMKDKTYNVEITLNRTGDIVSATCVCPRGIKCHHISTLALFGHYNISVTDKQCSWNAPKGKSDVVKTAEELYPRKNYAAIEETMTTEQKNVLKEKISALGSTVGFAWLLQSEVEGETDMANFPIIEDIITSVEFSEATDKIAFFQQKCFISDETIKEIATLTIGQVSNEKWYILRKFRITASNFGAILAACKRNRYPESLFKTLIGEYNLDGVKSIQWGRTHEKNGIEFLRQSLHLDVRQSGIWLTNSGMLGASPDGLVMGEDAIVEVKCPYTLRNEFLSKKLINSNKYIVYFDENGKIFVNQNHNYYHQIQGNLHILKRKKCYLCIWTLKEISVVLVTYNEKWGQNLITLENFYLKQYFPKLLHNLCI